MGVERFSPVMKMSLGETSSEIRYTGSAESTRPRELVGANEIGTSNKIACCALQNGQFTIFDLACKQSVFTSKVTYSSALTSIAYCKSTLSLVTGSRDGYINVYDIRSLNNPVMTFRRNGASIEDISFIPTNDSSYPEFAIGTSDGLPFRARVGQEGPIIVEEYAGYNCDAARVVRVIAGYIWIAGDDGVVRRY
jgi:proteasomal ATPase-associated factor 1